MNELFQFSCQSKRREDRKTMRPQVKEEHEREKGCDYNIEGEVSRRRCKENRESLSSPLNINSYKKREEEERVSLSFTFLSSLTSLLLKSGNE